MADTHAFFKEYLPNKVRENPDLAKMNVTFQFDITGAGIWTLHLKEDGSSVVPGKAEDQDAVDCVITCAQEDWENMLDDPSLGMMLFMQGKLKASNLGMATKLQQILG